MANKKRTRKAPKASAVKNAVPAPKGTTAKLVFQQLGNDSGVILRPAGKK